MTSEDNAQADYDNDPELQQLLHQAAEGPTIRRDRARRMATESAAALQDPADQAEIAAIRADLIDAVGDKMLDNWGPTFDALEQAADPQLEGERQVLRDRRRDRDGSAGA